MFWIPVHVLLHAHSILFYPKQPFLSISPWECSSPTPSTSTLTHPASLLWPHTQKRNLTGIYLNGKNCLIAVCHPFKTNRMPFKWLWLSVQKKKLKGKQKINSWLLNLKYSLPDSCLTLTVFWCALCFKISCSR